MHDPEERPRRPQAGSPVRPLGTGGYPREILVPVVLVIAAIVIAVVQPWAPTPPPTGSASSPGTGLATAPATTAAPTPTPDPYAELVTTCGYPSGWRAATLQRWTGRAAPIRTWSAIDPVPATGAGDPSIPFAPVATDLVAAIGYCSPVDADQAPPSVEVEIWAVPDTGPPVRLDGLQRFEPAHPNALGGLWLPEADRSVTIDGATGWAPGRYVVRLVALPFDRWLGIEIEDISGLRATPSAGPSASPAPSASP